MGQIFVCGRIPSQKHVESIGPLDEYPLETTGRIFVPWTKPLSKPWEEYSFVERIPSKNMVRMFIGGTTVIPSQHTWGKYSSVGEHHLFDEWISRVFVKFSFVPCVQTIMSWKARNGPTLAHQECSDKRSFSYQVQGTATVLCKRVRFSYRVQGTWHNTVVISSSPRAATMQLVTAVGSENLKIRRCHCPLCKRSLLVTSIQDNHYRVLV